MTARILAVDDESDLELLIRQRFRHRIKAGEIAFDFALNGIEALEKMRTSGPYDMVLTDINMPEMDGLALLSELRLLDIHFKAVVVSAYSDMGNIRTAMNRGAFDFITKPIDLKDLEATIDKTLQEAALIRQGILARENLDKALHEKEIAVIKMQKAEEAKKFEQQFLANMSHEIRTPMNAVIGMTHLVLKSELGEQQRKYLDAIRISSENLLGIINDILDVSKIEAGKIEFEKVPFRLSEVFSNVNSVLGFKAEEKKLKLSLLAEKEVPETLTGDPTRLNQVLINIVGNAIKFTEKGSVEVACSRVTQQGKVVSLRFDIKDSGIGIAPEKIETIFESFTQASADTTRIYGGTGLGLSISKQLVEMQGGEISARSTPGEGTTFSFTLPFEVAEEDAMTEQKSTAQPDLERLKLAKILLVEDNAFNQMVAVDTLKEYLGEIHIEIAVNGKEAIQKLQQKNYDIVLMDVQMPGMDGYEATKYIRTNLAGAMKNIPVLAMTASATKEEILKCLDSGMNDHVIKPFSPDNLLMKMTDLLSVKQK
jgi:signal transduction histidine kinase/BarA-like signal transduction histidine kinase